MLVPHFFSSGIRVDRVENPCRAISQPKASLPLEFLRRAHGTDVTVLSSGRTPFGQQSHIIKLLECLSAEIASVPCTTFMSLIRRNDSNQFGKLPQGFWSMVNLMSGVWHTQGAAMVLLDIL